MLTYKAMYKFLEQGVHGEVLDFPGANSQGRTLNSARRMIRDAMRLMVDWHFDDGKPLPRPNRKAADRKAIANETIPILVLCGGVSTRLTERPSRTTGSRSNQKPA